MQVKTYVGASTQEVMARIKAELGSDAVILSNRTFRKNGVRCHEFTVGIERDPAEASPAAASAGGTGAVGTGASAASAAGAASGFAAGAGTPPGWNDWHKEWVQIKEHLFALMKPSIQLELLSPRQRVALEYLQREGVADSVSVELYRRLRANTGSSVLEVLSEMVSVRTWGTEQWPQRLHYIAGPFGVGKTTAGLRMALTLRKQEPDMRIAFINADCQRGNGRLVLRHWAELSDFSYLEAHDAQSMAKALTASADAARVFIDMPGLSRGTTLTESISALGLHKHILESTEARPKGYEAASDACAVHLVLSPHYDNANSADLVARYQVKGAGSLVWTKLDEATSFGSLPNVAVQCGLPISALSYGSGLRDTLSPATESLLWRLIFKRQLPGPQSHGYV